MLSEELWVVLGWSIVIVLMGVMISYRLCKRLLASSLALSKANEIRVGALLRANDQLIKEVEWHRSLLDGISLNLQSKPKYDVKELFSLLQEHESRLMGNEKQMAVFCEKIEGMYHHAAADCQQSMQ